MSTNSVKYEPYKGDRKFWCNVHNRRATYLFTGLDGRTEHRCDPHKGGITLPCAAGGVVDITELVEIEC